ncbi:hypothetical protein ACH42_14475 [Endozoicomonas sp. (ex Bugula neritina AB1)]|nr:hypothetical protein ACH42_14475 [Endozoicomonas sp. (ex Bugula neritina AB1)]
MTRTYEVAISDAASLAGETLIRQLEERQFPATKLYPLGADDTVSMNYLGEELDLVDASTVDFSDIDLLFIPAGTVRDPDMMAQAVDSGCLVVDASKGAASMGHSMPVMPGINDYQLEEARLSRYVVVPSSPAALLLSVLKQIQNRYGLTRINLTACLSVANSGNEGVNELRGQTVQLLNGKPVETETYPHRIAYNLLPQVGPIDEQGVAECEGHLRTEISTLLSNDIDVRVTCVIAPVFFGDSLSVDLDSDQPMDLQDVADSLSELSAHELSESGAYPTAEEVAGCDTIQLGRLRQSSVYGTDLSFWLVADGVKRGAIAAVEVAELLIKDLAK